MPVETAIAMAKEMGADSLKYFPMGGLKVREEYQAVTKACAEFGFGLSGLQEYSFIPIQFLPRR